MSIGALLFLAGLSGARAAWSDGDVGVANSAVNLTSFAMLSNSSSECYEACVANASCGAWTMVVSSAACTAGGPAVCWIQGEFGGPINTDEPMEGARVPCYPNACAISGPVERPGEPLLQPLAFVRSPLSSVTPGGWLADELQVQGAGLSGFLDLFWAPVQDSVWVGGDSDGYLHEDGPYWLNGVTALAALLSSSGAPSANLTEQVQIYINTILANQSASGWLGPDDTHSGDEYWARFNVLSSFYQWAEAYPPQAPALYAAILRYVVESTSRQLSSPYQINDWSAARAHDYVLTLHQCV